MLPGLKEVSMPTLLRRCAVMLVFCGLAVGPAFSQGTPPADSFGFHMALGIGIQNFTGPVEPGTFSSIGLAPDISFGKFGIGLDLTINYDTNNGSLYIRRADWVVDSFQNFLEVYLPKIAYIRYGLKGDPLFLELGSFNDATLGDGFIMGSYSNMLFMPDQRHLGLQADLDGNLFNVPFFGFESVIGNLAQMDVLGGRVFVRPLVSTELPVLNNLEVGFTAAVDTNPFFGTLSVGNPSTIAVYGGDIRVPLVNIKDAFSLLAFIDVASIQSKSAGGMIGVSGRIISIFTYGLQLRALGADFIPDYFGPTYDLLRDQQYMIVQTGGFSPAMLGWLVTAGTSFLGDTIVFRVTLDGPFAPSAFTDPLLRYPHLRGTFSIEEGVVPGISFDFSYDKKALATLSDLVSAEDAAIQAQLNFRTGPAIISFLYKIVFDPTQSPHPWHVTSGLQTSIALF
jgi:hypothetical protein